MTTYKYLKLIIICLLFSTQTITFLVFLIISCSRIFKFLFPGMYSVLVVDFLTSLLKNTEYFEESFKIFLTTIKYLQNAW